MKKNNDFSHKVGVQAKRKQRAKRDKAKGIWFGLGMMGLIGYSIVVPTLLGVLCGIWLDQNHPGKQSWTLALLFVGLTIGCLNAWHWVNKEDREMRGSDNDGDNHE